MKDNTLLAATSEAYRGLLPSGKFGFVVLNVSINPEKVDVNVHPAKLEVRFSEDNKIFKTVCDSVKEGLLRGDLINAPYSETKDTVKADDTLTVSAEPEVEQKVNTGFFKNLLGKNKVEADVIEEGNENNILEEIYKNKKEHTNILENTSVGSGLDQTAERSTRTVNQNGQDHILQQDKLDKGQDVIQALLEMQKQVEELNNSKETITENTIGLDSNNIEKAENTIAANVANLPLTSEISDSEERKQDIEEEFGQMYEKLFGKKKETAKDPEDDEMVYTAKEMVTEKNLSVFEDDEEYGEKIAYKFVGIAFSTYIIVAIKNELYIIDQHAAHERIMYENIKDNFYSGEGRESQMLLMPDVITLTHKEMFITKENIAMFEKAGFTLEEFGENTIKLTGVPNIVFDIDTKELFLDILDEINTVARTARQEVEEKFIATVACKAAVKANMALTETEVDVLMKKLLELPNPFTCPHGRPTAIKMTQADIEKKFSRR